MILKDEGEDASRRSVCPPEINRVRKGKVGWRGEETEDDVRSGVRAWACYVRLA